MKKRLPDFCPAACAGREKNLLEWIFIILFLMVVIVLWIMLYDTHRFVIANYKINTSKAASDFRIVLLADLHNKQYGKDNHLLVQAVHEQKPDIICVAGDMMIAKPKKKYTPAVTLLRQLSSKYPVYYANGNHEQRMLLHPEEFGDMYERYTKELTDIGIKPLRNEHVEWKDANVVIHGLELPRKFFRRVENYPMEENYLEELLGCADGEKFQILLAHNPDYFPQYAAWGADLCLSGHVHGGLMRVPFLGGFIAPTWKLFPKYDGGEFTEGKSHMILSRGLGTHTLPIRIFNPGELIVIDVVKTPSGEKMDKE